MAKCSFETEGYSCPFDSKEDETLCIFHLPVEKKDTDEFWKCLANYLIVLIENTNDNLIKEVYYLEKTKTLSDAIKEASEKDKTNKLIIPWIILKDDIELQVIYNQKVKRDAVWKFTGFQFPQMNSKFNFQNFVFYLSDFTDTQFTGYSSFKNAKFLGKLNFRKAKFKGNVSFRRSKFRGYTSFIDTIFSSHAGFSETKFSESVVFRSAEFAKYAYFRWVDFAGNVNFNHTKFYGKVSFKGSQFLRRTFFSGAEFFENTLFSKVKLWRDLNFSRTIIHSHLTFNSCNIYNQLFFEGIHILENGLLLLWNINFMHGISYINIDKETLKGEITVPVQAGTIIFKDIPYGMNRISFLHTQIYYDRPYIRFFNVHWETEPIKFLFDANFVFNQEKNWNNFISGGELKSILPIFSMPGIHRQPYRALPEAEKHKLENLVKLDVERISREIRKFYEDFGNYPDAGDYYIAEMEYRRCQIFHLPKNSFYYIPNLFKLFVTKPKLFLYWLAISFYKWVSKYGESPSKALYWLICTIFVSAGIYLYAGFGINDSQSIKYYFYPKFPDLSLFIVNFFKSLLFALCNLIPNIARFHNFQYLTPWTIFFSFLEGIFGVSIITLFLLAIRRRFRR